MTNFVKTLAFIVPVAKEGSITILKLRKKGTKTRVIRKKDK